MLSARGSAASRTDAIAPPRRRSSPLMARRRTRCRRRPPPRPRVAPPAAPQFRRRCKARPVLWGTIALSLATFMNVLDTSIANVSIPAIAGDLGVSPSQGTWVITSFGVANAISVPLTGWLTQRFGQVRLFTASILLFVIASWLCGLAPNIGMLIAFRVLQGFVAGPDDSAVADLLLSSYPQRWRARRWRCGR